MAFCDVCWVVLQTSTVRTAHLNSRVHRSNEEFQKNCTNGQLDSIYHCTLCSKVFNSPDQLQIHMDSKAHADKITTREHIKTHYMALRNDTKTIEIIENSLRTLEVSAHALVQTNEILVNTEPLKCENEVQKVEIISEALYDDTNLSIGDKEMDNFGRKSGSEMSFSVSNCGDENDDLCWCKYCYIKYNSVTHREQHLVGRDHKQRQKFSSEKHVWEKNDKFCSICLKIMNNMDQMRIHINSDSHKKVLQQYKSYLKHHGGRSNASVTSSASTYEFSVTSTTSSVSALQLPKSNTLPILSASVMKTTEQHAVLSKSSTFVNEKAKFYSLEIFESAKKPLWGKVDKAKYGVMFEVIENSFEKLRKMIEASDSRRGPTFTLNDDSSVNFFISKN